MDNNNKGYRISIQFELKDTGEWSEPEVAAESLMAMAVAKLNKEDRPVDYVTGKSFELIFMRDCPNRIVALTWAKGIEESTLALWGDKDADIKDAEIHPIGILIKTVESAEPAEAE